MMVCSRPEDGLRCRHGVKPPPKLKLNIVELFSISVFAALVCLCHILPFPHIMSLLILIVYLDDILENFLLKLCFRTKKLCPKECLNLYLLSFPVGGYLSLMGLAQRPDVFKVSSDTTHILISGLKHITDGQGCNVNKLGCSPRQSAELTQESNDFYLLQLNILHETKLQIRGMYQDAYPTVFLKVIIDVDNA